jgi:outer membrane protein TolC
MKSFQARLSEALSLLIFAGLLTMTATGQEVHQFSATQAVDYAVKNSAQVKNALLGIQIQEQTNREITAAAFPKLSGSMSVNYFPNVAVQSFPNFIAAATYGVLEAEGVKNGQGVPIKSPSDFGFIQAAFGTKWNSVAGLSLDQLLFDGQVFVGLQARDAAIAYARKTAEITEEQIKVNIYKIYYQLVVGKDQIEAIDANIDRFEKLLHDTREIYKNGFAEKLDVNKVEVTLTNLKTEKIKVQYQLDAGQMGLKLLLGMPMRDSLVLTDTLSEERLKKDVLESSFAYHDRKEYQQVELAKELGEYNVKRYRMSYLPTLSLYGSYNQLAYRNQFNFLNFNEDWFTSSQIGLKLNVPIFDGMAKSARVKKASLELEQTRNNLENLKISIDNDIQQSQFMLKSALAALDFQSKNRELAAEVFVQTQKKYEQGLGSNQEITTAQTEYKTAETNYFNSLYAAIVAKVDYLKAIGKLQ